MPGPATTVSTTATVAGLTFAGIINAQIFGMPVGTIALATGFTLLGVMGRLGFEIARTADTELGVKWSKVAALFAGGCISSVAITVLYLALLNLIGVKNDGALVIGLVFLGFSGATSLPWIFNTASSTLNKKFGISIPLLGSKGAPADPPVKP